jgi:hypothetical protein
MPSPRKAPKKEVPINLTWDDAEIRNASETQWTKLPPEKPKKEPNPVDVVLDAVEKGDIKEVWAPDAAQLRRIRTALVRGAGKRGIKLEFRTLGKDPRTGLMEPLYVRKAKNP